MANDLIPANAPDEESCKNVAKDDSSATGKSDPSQKITTWTGGGGDKAEAFWAWGMFDAGIILLFWGWSEFFGNHNSPILSNVFFFGFVSSVLVALACFAFKHWPNLKTVVLICLLLCSLSAVMIYKFSYPFSSSLVNANENPQSDIGEWQPPELPPGCSNVTVWFGTWRMDEPVWMAKIPHNDSETNNFGTNSFTAQVSPNLTATIYHWGDIGTDTNAVRYAITDLPQAFVLNAEKMPDFSPRKRKLSLNNGDIKTPWFNGKKIDFPVLPLVISNRLFVDVIIPFINERRIILMNDNFGDTLTNLPGKWDINYDSNKFEIVNEQTNPILQVFYKSPNEVQVNGIYVINGFDIYAAFNFQPISFIQQMGDQPTQMMEIEDFEKLHTNVSVRILDTNAFFESKFPNQNAVFKYPSWEFFHQLVP